MAKQKIPEGDHPELVSRYRAGETLQQVGDSYGVSRERIRQILDGMGVRAKEGGIAKTARKRKAEAKAKNEARFFRKYGMTRERYREVQSNVGAQGAKPYECYYMQRRNALARGIPWHFTFVSWWDMWERSGKWAERGRASRDSYVMARYGDEGPYEPRNVRIIRVHENNSEWINRYWDEIREGIRPPPAGTGENPHGFDRLGDQPSIVIDGGNINSIRSMAHEYAGRRGWAIRTKTSGDQLKITRVA